MRFLLLLFIAIPIIEMVVLIKVGSAIGALSTVLLVLATAVIGVFLLRQQGLSTLWRLQSKVQSGQSPAAEMLEGIVLAFGGALLLTPGFVTDTIGFLCLIPFSRAYIAKFFVRRMFVSGMQGSQFGRSPYDQAQRKADKTDKKDKVSPGSRSESIKRKGDVIEGEFHRDD